MPDFPSSVMLFAAGFGTRMGTLTQDRPKPLIKVAGQPLIDHALAMVDEWRPDKVVVNLHYRAEMLRDHLADRDLTLVEEYPVILETGGGLRAALPALGDAPVFTMNTDAVWKGPNGLAYLASTWNPEVMDALLLCVPKTRALGHTGPGDFLTDKDGRALRGPGDVYTGLQILRTDMLHDIADTSFSLNILWDRMIESGRLFTARYPGTWCDVGRPDAICLAERLLGYCDV